MWNLINKCWLRQIIVYVKSCVSFCAYLRFRCGFCTSRKVRSVHLPLKRKTCSTGLQRTAGTATSRCRTIGGCTMTNASSKTPNLITTMRPTRRRRQVAVLPYSYWIIGYRNVLHSSVCNAAWHRRHKTVILYYFHSFNVSISQTGYYP